MMERPHSTTYTRVYNETYNRLQNASYLPLSTLTPAERNHYNTSMAESNHLLAQCAALRAESNEGKSATDTPTTARPTTYTPVRTSASLYTPSATFGTPYPTSGAPTERDLRNQFYWHQRDYNRMQQNARQDWNRWMYGRP